jgi:hypothetical protein
VQQKEARILAALAAKDKKWRHCADECRRNKKATLPSAGQGG